MDALTTNLPPAPETDEIVRAAQDELEQAIQRGGLARDPMRFALRALSLTLDAMSGLQRAASNHQAAVRSALAHETNAAIDRAKAEMKAAQAVSIERIAQAIAASADAALARRVRVIDRNSTFMAAAILVGVIVAALAGGFVWGQSVGSAGVQVTEAELRTAFRNGPSAAQTWLSLMRANDPAQVLAACTAAATWLAPDGRRACRAALWLDPPAESAPERAGMAAAPSATR